MSDRTLRKRTANFPDTKASATPKKRKLSTEASSKPHALSKTGKASRPHQKVAGASSNTADISSSSSPAKILIHLLNRTHNEPDATDVEPATLTPGSSSTKKSSKASKGTTSNSKQPPPLQLKTPFEELLGTLVVSRPIPRTLGHRAVRTLLSPPYDFTTPGALLEAGEKRVFEALVEAKTLHKDKTASQLIALATTAMKSFEFPAKTEENDEIQGQKTGLEKLRRDANGDAQKLKATITKEVKGLGKTGTDIFLRRVQRMWGEFWPVVDDRTSAGLKALGLPSDAKNLRKLVDDCWDELNLDIAGGEDEESQKRYAFVEILRNAVHAELKEKEGDKA